MSNNIAIVIMTIAFLVFMFGIIWLVTKDDYKKGKR